MLTSPFRNFATPSRTTKSTNEEKMSYARKRQKLDPADTPFVFFGQALPPLDPEIRDDGTFVPLWQQEVHPQQR
jgi:hypothetical protein